MYVWRSEDNFWNSILSLSYGPSYWTLAVRFSQRCLSHWAISCSSRILYKLYHNKVGYKQMFLFSSKEEPSINAQMQKGHVGLEADISGPSIATHGHDCSSCSVGIGNWILSSLYVVVFHFHIKVGKINSYTSIFVSVIWVFLCSHTHLGLLHHLGIDSIIVPHHTPLTFAFNSFFCFEIYFI